MNFKTYLIIIVAIISAIFVYKVANWQANRIEGARERCKITCGYDNYECRDKCFSYEYCGD